MIEVLILLLLFLAVGITARKFNGWVRLLLCIMITGVVALLYFT